MLSTVVATAFCRSRKRSYLEIVIAVVERQGDTAWREPRLIEGGERLGKREHGVAATFEGRKPRLERRRRHVELRIPLMLVFERNTVVAEDE